MQNIFLSLSHGFHVRNFLQTPFITELSKPFRIIIIISKADQDYLERFLERLGLGHIEVVGVEVREKSYENFFLLLRKNIFVSPKRAKSKNIINDINDAILGKWKKTVSVFNAVFGSFEFTRALWRNFEKLFITGKEFDGLFKQYKPALLVTADYGTKPFEIRLIRSAKRHGVKSIAVVPSWDNLTSKGVMGIKPDFLAVWNDIMLDEAVELHAFHKNKVLITGPLQFDNFYDARYRMSEDEFRSKFQIEKGRPIIVFGTITPKYFRFNIEMLKIIGALIKTGEIRKNPKILVRIHPQVVKDPVYGDNLDQYLALAKGNSTFCLSIPEIEEWATMQVPRETDYNELISILTYSNICIASASTLIFDAFACNTCFIGIGFDGEDKNIPKEKSVRRMFEFEHYKHVYKLGGFGIAESKEDLAKLINTYLDHPLTHEKERRLTLEQQIKFFDGKNFERVMKAVDSIQNGKGW